MSNPDQIQPDQTPLQQSEKTKPLGDCKTLGDFKTLGAMRDSFYELMEQDRQGFRH